MNAMAIVLNVTAGEPFSVELDSNATTGYQWQLKENNAAIEIISQNYTATQPSIPGKPGKTIFTLRINSSGSYQVDFILKRGWEAEEKAISRMQYTFHAV